MNKITTYIFGFFKISQHFYLFYTFEIKTYFNCSANVNKILTKKNK